MKVRLPGPMNIVLPQPLSGSRLVSAGSLAGRVSTETQLTGTTYDGVDFAGQFRWAWSGCRPVAKKTTPQSERMGQTACSPHFPTQTRFLIIWSRCLTTQTKSWQVCIRELACWVMPHYASIQWGKSSIPQFYTADVWIMASNVMCMSRY